MKSLVFDSTIWIDALNKKNTEKVELLRNIAPNENSVILFPVIAQEVLQGIKSDEQFKKVYQNLNGFTVFSLPPWETHIGAAILYRDLRKKGITIRKPNDCIIAFLAIHFKLELVHNDSDFDLIAQNSPLKIYKP